ncbi:unnamed protein product, partial [Didymodactylos carnosus]
MLPDTYETSTTRRLKFYLLIIFQIPSICCSLYLFHKFIINRKLRCRLQNHIIICILISNFLSCSTELPITLAFLHNNGQLKPSTAQFCLIWIYWNHLLNAHISFFVAWASIERHLFIFYPTLIRTRSVLYHYFPITCCSLYAIVWYSYFILLYPCSNTQLNYKQLLCFGPCYQYQIIIRNVDLILNVFGSTFIIIIANLTLIVRVIVWRKRHMNIRVTNEWRKNFKMVVQLLLISLLFSISWLPLIVVLFIRLVYKPNFLQYLTTVYLLYTPYLSALITPLMCLVATADIKAKKYKLN